MSHCVNFSGCCQGWCVFHNKTRTSQSRVVQFYSGVTIGSPDLLDVGNNSPSRGYYCHRNNRKDKQKSLYKSALPRLLQPLENVSQTSCHMLVTYTSMVTYISMMKKVTPDTAYTHRRQFQHKRNTICTHLIT